MKCPSCGTENEIVNQCGCDPQNLATVCDLSEIDCRAVRRGLRYKVSPRSKAFEPLYVRTLAECGPVMRQFPNEKFSVGVLPESLEDMNGQPIYEGNDTLFIPIPRHLARTIDGGCQCEYCKAHPEVTPKWDTLAIPATPGKNHHTWTVHMPNKQGLRFYKKR